MKIKGSQGRRLSGFTPSIRLLLSVVHLRFMPTTMRRKICSQTTSVLIADDRTSMPNESRDYNEL